MARAVERLRRIVERGDTPAGRRFDIFIQALIVLSLITFSIGTVPDLGAGTERALWSIEVFTVAVFTIEYLSRVLVARNRARFIFSFLGLVDLAAILPFYLALGVDLRSIRILRLLRLFRAIKLLRYSEAAQRFRHAFALAREELVLFFSVAGMLFYFSAVGIYYFENPAQPEKFRSIFDSFWWAVVTLTSVGYGDIYPITPGGKLFTAFILAIGLGVVAVPSGLMASALSEARRVQDAEAAAAESETREPPLP